MCVLFDIPVYTHITCHTTYAYFIMSYQGREETHGCSQDEGTDEDPYEAANGLKESHNLKIATTFRWRILIYRPGRKEGDEMRGVREGWREGSEGGVEGGVEGGE